MNSDHDNPDTGPEYFRRHMQFGWVSLLCFLSLGIFLETLWALRVDWFVNDIWYMRRLVWRLGHAHGTLFAMLHVLYAFTIRAYPGCLAGKRRLSSPCFIGASILMPGGFFLGGMFLYGQGGDPGVGIFLVPVGAVCLFVAVLLTVTGLKD